MSIALFTCPSKSCWRMPTRHCFALRVNIDLFASVRNADDRPNDSGIDDLNDILRSPISYLDQIDRKTPHQIPIACALI